MSGEYAPPCLAGGGGRLASRSRRSPTSGGWSGTCARRGWCSPGPRT